MQAVTQHMMNYQSITIGELNIGTTGLKRKHCTICTCKRKKGKCGTCQTTITYGVDNSISPFQLQMRYKDNDTNTNKRSNKNGNTDCNQHLML